MDCRAGLQGQLCQAEFGFDRLDDPFIAGFAKPRQALLSGHDSHSHKSSHFEGIGMKAMLLQVHLQQHGFHPYAFEVAGLVRMGVMTREEGLTRLGKSGDEGVIQAVKSKLGLT